MWDAMFSIGISKHLNEASRYSIILNWVNEIILPRLYFVYKGIISQELLKRILIV